MRTTGWLSKWMVYGWCCLVLMALLAAQVDPSKVGFLSIMGTAMPWLILGLFVLCWFLRKNWLVLLPIACLVMSWEHLTAFAGWHFLPAEKAEKPLNVVSWNLGALWSHKEKPDDIHAHQLAFFDFLNKKALPDILCTQEIGGDFITAIAEETGLLNIAQVAGKQTVIFSKFPIEKSGEVPFEKTSNSAIWADVRLENGKVVRIFCAHLQSNSVSADADRIAESGKLDQKETWYSIGSILKRVNRGTQKRARQARALADMVARSQHPAILCGDFNDTPASFTYHILSKNLADPFRRHGFGLGTTYRGSIPLLRIDYILADEKLRTVDYRSFNAGLGDHDPVFCRFDFSSN